MLHTSHREEFDICVMRHIARFMRLSLREPVCCIKAHIPVHTALPSLMVLTSGEGGPGRLVRLRRYQGAQRGRGTHWGGALGRNS